MDFFVPLRFINGFSLKIDVKAAIPPPPQQERNKASRALGEFLQGELPYSAWQERKKASIWRLTAYFKHMAPYSILPVKEIRQVSLTSSATSG